MGRRDVKNKPPHSGRTLLIAPLFFPPQRSHIQPTSIATEMNWMHFRIQASCLRFLHPGSRGSGGLVLQNGAHRHYTTPGGFSCTTHPSLRWSGGYQRRSESPGPRAGPRSSPHRRCVGAESSRAELLQSVSQSVSHGDVITAKANWIHTGRAERR